MFNVEQTSFLHGKFDDAIQRVPVIGWTSQIHMSEMLREVTVIYGLSVGVKVDDVE